MAGDTTITVPDVISAQGLTGCVIDDCGRPIVGRGRCRRHYQRWWKASRGRDRPAAMNLRTKTVEERFWAKVNRQGPAECWPWTGSRQRFGHGEFFVSRERGKVQAHVFAKELATGRPCPPDREGCHHCDNPPCCNPAHVYYGTRKQNVDDMIRRGRARRACRLTAAEVVDIRERFAAGITSTVLASQYRIGASHLSAIVNGRIWRSAAGPVGTHGRPGRRPNQGVAA